MPWTRTSATELDFVCKSSQLVGSRISLKKGEFGTNGKYLGIIIFDYDEDLNFDEKDTIFIHQLLRDHCSQVLIRTGAVDQYQFMIVPGKKKSEEFIECLRLLHFIDKLSIKDFEKIISLVETEEIKEINEEEITIKLAP
ncbi:MAG: hypothetical protein LCH30_09090 [Proteobacteria bacterium]|nr:hypothetical protein [Pseudomonadota bacterium]